MRIKERVYELWNIAKKYVNSLRENKIINVVTDYKHGEVVIIIILSVIIFFAGSYTTTYKYSKNDTIKYIEKALQNSNEKKILKVIRTENKNINLSKEDIKPLIRFYEEDKARINILIDALKKDQEQYSLKLGKKDNFFSDEYYLQLSLKELNITSNFQESNIFLNKEYKGKIDSSGSLHIKNIVPGIHDISIEKEGQYSNLFHEETVVFTEDKSINLPLKGIMVSLVSNFPKASVYINGEDSGLKVDEFQNMGPFAQDGSTSVMVKYETPWGVIASDNIYITEYPQIAVNIDLKNSSIIEEVNEVVTKFYESVFVALNSQNKEDINYSIESVKDSVYNILNKKYFIFKNTYEISDLNIKMENSEIAFKDGEYLGNIVVNVSYKAKKRILGLNIKTDEYSEDFFTTVKYVEGKWLISNIENFSLNGLTQTLNK